MRNDPFVVVAIQIPGPAEGNPGLVATEMIRNRDVSDEILSMKYEDSDNKADKLVLQVDNDDLRNFDDPIWRFGNQIFVSWGYREIRSLSRKMEIRKVTGFRELTVEALGGQLAMHVIKRNEVYHDKTRSEVAVLMARRWGFVDDEQLYIEPTPVRYETITQGLMTDAELMSSLAQKENFIWNIDHDGFHFHKRDYTVRTLRRMTYYTDQSRTEILDIDIDIDVTRRAGSVSAAAYAPKNFQPIGFNATTWEDSQKASLGAKLEAPGMGEWDVPGIGHIGHHDLKLSTEETDEAVARDAQAERARAQEHAVKMKVTIVGDPSIQAKSIVYVGGIGKRLSQKYYVKEVTHSIGRGYTCQLDLISSGSGGMSTKSEFLPQASSIQMMPANGKQPAAIDNPGTPIGFQGAAAEKAAAEGKISPLGKKESVAAPAVPVTGNPYGALVAPTLDLRHRPYVKNADGSVSTVRSIGVEFNGLQFLIPTVSDDGRIMSDQEAIKTFEETGKHMGAYPTIEAANRAGEAIHLDQVKNPPINTLEPRLGQSSVVITPEVRKALESAAD